ncbi:ArsR/SmtB family transcription factor [Thiomicrorhabdus sediminis]|uniref:Metalloregulator ArsR/SmtB family transcription factor n=1 Tax=Thiomicrorhabdus sediminis TaxID=2580412 RepID=A0A4P9K5F3_9GAMM|nr:metalloregulator ArsR/SmtB family transcription factor [Thiomicrorhabdus sediminis]QCU90244.1 metalloregulator ArsR/SmtB family transcription factor [Thiomicrorhabdus sediminis]
MSSQPLKRNLFEQLAQVSKSLGQANRLMILDILTQGECDVDTLHQKLGLSVANVSKHLQNLKQAGLVKNRREGLRIIYALSDDSVFRLIVSLREVAETQLEEMQSLLAEHIKPNTPLEPISLQALKKMQLNDESFTLLDVRPQDEFSAGHLPSAINIPIDELPKSLGKLNNQKPVIIYCRGPYCMWSHEAVEALRAKGYEAKRLNEGYPEWQAQEVQ